jgi:murein DD-endopeptidase MepM/ murein hydrolase activator NlpD
MRMTRATLALCLLASGLAADEASTLARGRELSTLYLERKVGRIWDEMDAKMHEAMGARTALAAFRAHVEGQAGDEVDILEEKASTVDGYEVYTRKSRWSKAPTPVTMQWTFDAQGRVAGFFVRPTPDNASSDYQTKADLRLPFRGTWHVFWGGRTAEQNYHVQSRDQRFAYDLLIRRDGKSHRGKGKKVEDYYCWNEPILAPAAGTVAGAADGLPDQKPGQRDPGHPPGNHVVLDLGNGEYALLAHLRQGSVKVKAGDKVKTGDELGRCGNSGNTSEPHLHFHLQDAPSFGNGEGLPAFFNDYVADGTLVPRGEPVKGQEIAPAPSGQTPRRVRP